MKLASNSLLALLVGVLASAGAVAQTGTRTVETTRVISARPGEMLDAFLDDGDLKAWWRVSRSLVEREEGGIWSVTWEDWGEEKTLHAWVGEIDQLTSNKLLVRRLVMIEPEMPLLAPLQLQIVVEPADGGTAVTVTHSGYGYGDHWDEIYELVVNGWNKVLGDLDTWAQQEYRDDRALDPEPMESGAEESPSSES